MSRIYFITGAGSGFGRALAEAVLERGDCAVLTARRPEAIADLAGEHADNALAVRLDVTDERERQAAVQTALERFGRVDVLVNIEPVRKFLYGNSGKQAGDPRKAARAMIAAVESDEPPLRLMLGADAYDLWEQKRAVMDEEAAKWRELGEDTAFSGAEKRVIGT